MKISVIINTYERAEYLRDLLDSLKHQSYDNFEVIVVNGPSKDNTKEVALRYNVKYYETPFAVLGISRNIGIKNASGDIIVFIDDDSIPDADWLKNIIYPYSVDAEGKTGAVGGWVVDENTGKFQFVYAAVSIRSDDAFSSDKPYDFNKPHAVWYNSVMGTNAAYLRTVLIKAGGFDERYNIFRDETDVCIRLINEGYKICIVDNAIVHHKIARDKTNRHSHSYRNINLVTEDQVYFILKNSIGVVPLHQRLIMPLIKESGRFHYFWYLYRTHQISFTGYILLNITFTMSFIKGYLKGCFLKRKLIKGYKFDPGSFKKFIVK